MAKKRAVKAPTGAPVPQDDAAASAMVARIGQATAEAMAIEAALDEQLLALREDATPKITALDAEISGLVDALAAYCAAHRTRLTGDGRTKSHRFPAGTVAWRDQPPRVRLSRVDEVVARLRALGLDRFLRVSACPDKDAMLKEPEVASAVDGVKIERPGEKFYVTPDGAGPDGAREVSR